MAAVIPASASAAITATSVTSPASQTSFFVDQAQSTSTATAFTVSGTANAAGNVDVDCTNPAGGSMKFVAAVPVTAGAFAIPVTYVELDAAANAADAGPCVLRVVPSAAVSPAPGASSPYGGPLISVSYEDVITKSGVAQDFYAQYTGTPSGSAGTLEFTSPASCGLEASWITTGTSALTDSNGAFDCMGAFYPAYTSTQAASVKAPSELTVDGAAAVVANTFSGATTLHGYAPPTFTDSFSNGVLTVNDDEPIMVCASACPSGSGPSAGFTPSGVELDRTWVTADNGLVVMQTDTFRSTDGRAHAMTALEDDDFNRNAATNGSADFPGTAGFQVYAAGNTINPVSGAGAIYFKTDAATPDSGDPALAWPQGAIVYSRAPSSAIGVTYWPSASDNSWYPEFYLPYTLEVPAGGTAALRFAYVQDFALGDVKTLAQQVTAGFNPSLAISAPSNGAALDSPLTTVSGTAGDAAGIKSLTVDGVTVPVSNGGFSTNVDLAVGANTITVVATDADGLATTQTASVTVAMQSTSGLGVKVRSRKHRTYKVTGKLALPAGVSAAQGCTGGITLTAKAGHRKVATASATVGATCSWSATLKAKRLRKHGKRLRKHGRLTLTVAFKGNAAIKPYTAKPVTIRY